MGGRSRQRIFGDRIQGARINALNAQNSPGKPSARPIWKLEAALKCRACGSPGDAPPTHLIRLTKERKIAPYPWVHPDDDR